MSSMFQIHKTLLQLCKSRDNYQEWRKQLPDKGLDAITELWIELYDKYWKRFEHATLQLDSLLTLMVQLGYDQDSMDKVASTWDIIKEEPDKESARGITKGLAELKAAHDLGKILIAYEDGEDIALYEECSGILEHLGKQSNLDISPAFDSWADIKAALHSPGKHITFPLSFLNDSMIDAATGCQMILGARPDVGKTSLCAFLAVHMAKQAPSGRTILVLNNESTRYKWMDACYRSAIGMSTMQLKALDDLQVQQKYVKTGVHDKIKVVDIHGFNMHACERLIQKFSPFVVIWDMIDSIRGFESEGREDLALERKYQFARELAVRYDFFSIPTSQLRGSAEGVEFPDKAALAGSKVGKQGACEAILMLGHTNDPTKARERYFGLPKNKFNQAPGARKDCGKVSYFQWEIARFKEV